MLTDFSKHLKGNTMGAVELDELDKRILKLLQKDARRSFAEIGRSIDIAETTVRFRVNRLVESGVITRFAALLDPEKVGLTVGGAILFKIDPSHLDEACKELAAFEETQYLFRSTGEYDVVSMIFARDMEHLNDLVKRAKMIVGVKDARLSVTTKMLKFAPSIEL
jgi:Lrp/AsnC family transcriptional regulator for asnA, asnC and gidA